MRGTSDLQRPFGWPSAVPSLAVAALCFAVLSGSGASAGESGAAGAVPFETAADGRIEAAILAASPDYTKEMVDIDGLQARYLYARTDLNDDGREEVLAYLLGSMFCGTGGCDLLLLTEDADGYVLVDSFAISRLPVVVAEERTNGWRNLYRLEYGGGAGSSWVLHTFDGERYMEGERFPGEPAPAGTPYLAGDFVFDDGIPLEPRN